MGNSHHPNLLAGQLWNVLPKNHPLFVKKLWGSAFHWCMLWRRRRKSSSWFPPDVDAVSELHNANTIGDGQGCYCLEGESPSIKTPRNYPENLSLFCHFSPLELVSGSLDLCLTIDLFIEVCFCLCFSIYLKWDTALSLNMFMILFVTFLLGQFLSTKLCNSPHFPIIFLIIELRTSSLSSSSSSEETSAAAGPSAGLGVPLCSSASCGLPSHFPSPQAYRLSQRQYP